MKRASELTQQKAARVLAAAQQDIALVRRKRAEVAGAFYDVGEALTRLKRPEVYAAFRHPSWGAFCTFELAMSESRADRLIEIAQRMTREDAIKLGTLYRASGVARLVQALPAKHSVAHAIREGIVIGKKVIDVNRASVREIAQATREVLQPKGLRGRRLTAEDAEFAAKVIETVESKGIDARIQAKAGMAGRGARLVVDVAMVDSAIVGRAISAAYREMEILRRRRTHSSTSKNLPVTSP